LLPRRTIDGHDRAIGTPNDILSTNKYSSFPRRRESSVVAWCFAVHERRWGSRWQARGVPPAIGMPIETPAKLHAFAGTTV
jgi:hypothetical protein